jgi:dATP/dGTP diphosphohydrolase, N-terminal
LSKLFGDDYEGRKAIPIFEGVLMYFPKAIAAVAEVSEAGNKQHNPGQPLHWARGKSMDQYNTALRHMMDHRMGGGRMDPQQEGQEINNGWVPEPKDGDGVRHLAKAAWRVLAALELAIEEEENDPHGQPPVDNDHVAPGCEKFDEAPRWKEVKAKEIPSVGFVRCACKKWNTRTDEFRWVHEGVFHTVGGCGDTAPSDLNFWVKRV